MWGFGGNKKKVGAGPGKKPTGSSQQGRSRVVNPTRGAKSNGGGNLGDLLHQMGQKPDGGDQTGSISVEGEDAPVVNLQDIVVNDPATVATAKESVQVAPPDNNFWTYTQAYKSGNVTYAVIIFSLPGIASTDKNLVALAKRINNLYKTKINPGFSGTPKELEHHFGIQALSRKEGIQYLVGIRLGADEIAGLNRFYGFLGSVDMAAKQVYGAASRLPGDKVYETLLQQYEKHHTPKPTEPDPPK